MYIALCGNWELLWLTIRTVIVFISSLAAIRAQWMTSTMGWSVGYARPMPLHVEDCACPMEPKVVSRLWGE
jgi:hypothetical protein